MSATPRQLAYIQDLAMDLHKPFKQARRQGIIPAKQSPGETLEHAAQSWTQQQITNLIEFLQEERDDDPYLSYDPAADLN